MKDETAERGRSLLPRGWVDCFSFQLKREVFPAGVSLQGAGPKALKEGRNVSAHADGWPIRGQFGFLIVISSARRTRFAAP